jgi:tRNA G10  N-methylase Trm11
MSSQSKDAPSRLLDPFCGTGVLLQEAALMGYEVYGTDLEPRMIDYSKENLEWLKRTHKINFSYTLDQGDATSKIWQPPLDLIVCETYLGQPFSAEPSQDKLREVMQTCNSIVREFLKNIAPQIAKGTPLCLGVPAWHVKNRVFHLAILDSLEEIGYNRRDFRHAKNEALVYHREDQVVGRELLVLTRS